MLNNFAASNYQLVELKVPANTNSTRVYFQDQPNLRNKIIEKIEIYSSFAFPNAPSGVSNSLTSLEAFLTLSDSSGNDFIQDLNVWEINGIYYLTNSVPQNFNAPFCLKPKNVVFTKSYISYAISNPSINAYSICFGVYYK